MTDYTTTDSDLRKLQEFEGCSLTAYRDPAGEGCSLTAYRDPAGIWTIGTGHTRGVKPGQVITQAQADQLLRGDLREVETQVNYLGVCETQGQFAALVSFTFNLGIGNLRRSTLLRKIRHGAPTLEGLVKRREWEARRWAE